MEANMKIENAIDAIRDYLDADNWNYDFNAEKQFIKCGVNISCKLKSIHLFISFNDNGYTVYGICPMNADEETMSAVSEYITRANYGLRCGNFELDYSDGQVRYKVYTSTRGMDSVTTEVIKESIDIPCFMFDRYGDGLAALIMGFSDPTTEIEKAEKKD